MFTRESVRSIAEQHDHITAYCNALLEDSDAENDDINTEDMHGYIVVNEYYRTDDYYDLL